MCIRKTDGEADKSTSRSGISSGHSRPPGAKITRVGRCRRYHNSCPLPRPGSYSMRFFHAVPSRRLPALPRPLPRTDHRVPQKMVHPSLITPPITLQPLHNVRVETHSHWLLCRPVELPHLRPAPVHHFRHLRQINVGVLFPGDAGDLALLLSCELPHSFSSPCWSRRERR